MYRCPYCHEEFFENNLQYCPSCGHLIQIIIHTSPKQQKIDIKYVVLLLAIGMTTYFIIDLGLHTIGLRIGMYFLAIISMLTSILLGLYFIVKKVQYTSLEEFFPDYKVFILLIGVLLWVIEILNGIIDNLVINQEIDLIAIYQLSAEFILGYFSGFLMIHFLKRLLANNTSLSIKVEKNSKNQ